MSGLRGTLAQLHTLRGKFERLLASARLRPLQPPEQPASHPGAHPAKPLERVAAFGSNPGNLQMFVHAPPLLERSPALVVALHGCSQNAAAYNHGSGWSTLADRHGFVVVLPEQQPANNPQNCFSWFVPGDTSRNSGEALSIHQMVEHAIATYGVDRGRVFVTGLSAGGAMASVMLATYPEVYAGGAIIAGLPFGCASSVQEAFEAMFTEQLPSTRALGDRVRAASRHQGPWPKLSVWHGAADPIVKPSNAEHLIRQWASVHGISATPAHEKMIGQHTHRVWTNRDGATVIEAYTISGMGHGVPLATSLAPDPCGAVGPFFLDAGLSSTHQIARFWGLDKGLARDHRATARQPAAQPQAHIDAAAFATTTARRSKPLGLDETSADHGVTLGAHGPFDPNAVIAAAFTAAGLPPPEVPPGPARARGFVDPGPIIAAALKAAGLKR